jgi:hypothetical protein
MADASRKTERAISFYSIRPMTHLSTRLPTPHANNREDDGHGCVTRDRLCRGTQGRRDQCEASMLT